MSDLSEGRKLSLARRLARLTLPDAPRHRLGEWASLVRTNLSPDRIYLRAVLLARIAGRGGTVLLVGCRSYTRADPAFLLRRKVVCWTLDVDPEAARWGVAGAHVVAPIQDAASHFNAAMFDTVVLSGVFGFGVNDLEGQEAAIAACSAVIKPDGLLVLGWNTDRVPDPARLSNLGRCFRPSLNPKFPARKAFRVSTHIFSCYYAVPSENVPESYNGASGRV